MAQPLDDEGMASCAQNVLGLTKKNQKEEDELLRSFFGVPLNVLTNLWNLLVPLLDLPGAHSKHMLWALVFIKIYASY